MGCEHIKIFRFFKMADAAILDFSNRKILLATGVQRVETHQHAKFCRNRSIGCEDIKIFPFFKMAAAALSHFWNREFLFAVGIWRAQTHQCTKFRKNWSFHCGDIAIFSNFQDGHRRHLGFLKSRNFIGYWGPEGGGACVCQILSKLVNRLRRY